MLSPKWQICRCHRLWASSCSSFHFWSTLNSPTRWGTKHWPLSTFVWSSYGLSPPVPPASFFIVHPINQLSVPSGPDATRLTLSKYSVSGVVVKQIDVKSTDVGGNHPRVAVICHRSCLQIHVLWNLYNPKPICADIGSSKWKIKEQMLPSSSSTSSSSLLLLLVIIGSSASVIQSGTWEVTMNWRGSHVVHSSNLDKGCCFIETTSNVGMASPLWSGHSHNLCCNHCYDFSLWGHCLIFTLSDLCCPPIQEIYSSQGRWHRLSTGRNTVRPTLSGAPSELLLSFFVAQIQPGVVAMRLQWGFVPHWLTHWAVLLLHIYQLPSPAGPHPRSDLWISSNNCVWRPVGFSQQSLSYLRNQLEPS